VAFSIRKKASQRDEGRRSKGCIAGEVSVSLGKKSGPKKFTRRGQALQLEVIFNRRTWTYKEREGGMWESLVSGGNVLEVK